MATNYPSALDDATTLGGPFVNAAPPVDPFEDIDALWRNNLNETTIAIETRLGITGDTNVASIDWATLTVSGVPNQGTRFAGTHVAWPGVVGESGLFIDDATGNVSFHKSGDPLSTFYDLTTGGGASTWDTLYATTQTLDIDTNVLTFTQSSATGTGFKVDRDEAASDAATMVVQNVNASDTQAALSVISAGNLALDVTGSATFAGPVDITVSTPSTPLTVNHSGPPGASPIFKAMNGASQRLLIDSDGHLQNNPIQPASAFDTHKINIISGGIDGAAGTVGIHNFVSSITGSTSDTNQALMVGFRAYYTDDGGAGSQIPIGFLAGDSFTFGILSQSQIAFNGSTTLPGLSVTQLGTGDLVQLSGSGAAGIDINVDGEVLHATVVDTYGVDAYEMTITAGGGNAGLYRGLHVSMAGDPADNSNTFYGVDLAYVPNGTTPTAYGVNISANWDYGLYNLSPMYVSYTFGSITSEVDQISIIGASPAAGLGLNGIAVQQKFSYTPDGDDDAGSYIVGSWYTMASASVGEGTAIIIADPFGSDSNYDYGIICWAKNSLFGNNGVSTGTYTYALMARLDPSNTLASGEKIYGVRIEVDGDAGDDADSIVYGVHTDLGTATGGTSTAYVASGDWDVGLDASARVAIDASSADTALLVNQAGAGGVFVFSAAYSPRLEMTIAGDISHAPASPTAPFDSYTITTTSGGVLGGGTPATADGIVNYKSQITSNPADDDYAFHCGFKSEYVDGGGVGIKYPIGFWATNTTGMGLFSQAQINATVNSDNPGIWIAQEGTGDALRILQGPTGATVNRWAFSSDGETVHTPADPTAPFSAYDLTLTSGGSLTSGQIITLFKGTPIGDGGDAADSYMVAYSAEDYVDNGGAIGIGISVGTGYGVGLLSLSPTSTTVNTTEPVARIEQTGSGDILRLSGSSAERFVVSALGRVIQTPVDDIQAYDLDVAITDVAGDYVAMTVNPLHGVDLTQDGKDVVGIQATVYGRLGDTSALTAYHSGFEAVFSGTLPTDTDVRCIGFKSGAGLLAGAFHESTLVVEVDTTSSAIPAAVVIGDTNNTNIKAFLSCFDGLAGSGVNRLSVYRDGEIRIATDTAIGKAAILIGQDDEDEPFIKYSGTTAGDDTKNISTMNGDGVVEGPKNYSSTNGWQFEGMVRVDVNGTDYWMPYYSVDAS